jgi:Protein of unknown function (DUF3455)
MDGFCVFVPLWLKISLDGSNTRPSSATSSFGMQNVRRREIMNHLKLKLFILIALIVFVVQPAFASNGPELPPQCGLIAVEEGHQLQFHVYAKGVQIYKWNDVTMFWDFVGPRADLFAESSFHGEVGDHFSGPNWQSKSGSRVKAEAVLGKTCTPDPSAIAWLQLKAKETTGSGIFGNISYILRVNTTGGLRPTTPGTVGGEIKEVEYTAEYYFYRAENPNGN